ncbi:four helix bundle protein [Nevskia soli]|uniref:four helix bundle protein n=1 Tax=Nevskia soli TaxID=418856 RepID=UPI001B808C09|nr:four helix bundle protein [Nevskia soli]
MIKSYTDLVVWQKAIQLAKDVYRVSQGFPGEERFGLTAQMRRAAISVPSNIAEGQGRLSKGEFKQFLGHARGSLYELETQMHLAISFGYLDNEVAGDLMASGDEVGRLLNGLLVALK